MNRKTHTRVSLIAYVFLACLSVTSRANAANTDDIAALVRLDEQRCNAMLNSDIDTLSSMLSEELVFIHASGRIDTKESIIQRIESGNLVYRRFDTSIRRAAVIGTLGLLIGTTTIDISAGGKDLELYLHFTAVWNKDNDTWKMESYQSTHAPKAP